MKYDSRNGAHSAVGVPWAVIGINVLSNHMVGALSSVKGGEGMHTGFL